MKILYLMMSIPSAIMLVLSFSCSKNKLEPLHSTGTQNIPKLSGGSNYNLTLYTPDNRDWYCDEPRGNCIWPPIVVMPDDLMFLEELYALAERGDSEGLRELFLRESELAKEHFVESVFNGVLVGDFCLVTLPTTESRYKGLRFVPCQDEQQDVLVFSFFI